MKSQITTAIFITILLLNCFNGYSQRNSSLPIPMPNQSALSHSKTPNDTLLPGNLPFVTTPEYVMLKSENGGYILGTNGWNDKCKCEQFKVTYNYKIEGAIYWFGYKYIIDTGLVQFGIWNMDGTTGTIHDTNNQACPGTLFVSITDTTTHIDITSSIDQAYIAMFPIPVLVSSDYCIGFDMSKIKSDSIALVSTKTGQGGNRELVWEQWSVNDKWYTLQGAQWDGGTLDVDAMILPIIDNTAGCVENGDFISGIKLSQSYPNPGKDECIISYEFATPPASASLEILDQGGKRVYLNQNIKSGQGVNTTVVDVSGFKNGVYFYILSSGKSRLAKKMIISR